MFVFLAPLTSPAVALQFSHHGAQNSTIVGLPFPTVAKGGDERVKVERRVVGVEG